MRPPQMCPAISTPSLAMRGCSFPDWYEQEFPAAQKETAPHGEPFLSIVCDLLSVAGRRTGAKTTPKQGRKRTTIVLPDLRSKRQSRSTWFHLCWRWSFLVHPRPSSAAPAAGRYCAPAEKKRCVSPVEL